MPFFPGLYGCFVYTALYGAPRLFAIFPPLQASMNSQLIGLSVFDFKLEGLIDG